MQLTADRQLGAWSSAHPSAVVHLPSGLGLKVSTYSSREGRYLDHRDTVTVTLLEKTPHLQRLRLSHAGSVVAVDVVHDGPARAIVRCRLIEPGEWALRFWTIVEVGRVAPPQGPAIDGRPGSRTRVVMEPRGRVSAPSSRVGAAWRSTHLAVHVRPQAARAGAYADLDELRAELEGGGYYLPHDDAADPTWVVLRYSMQEQPEITAALALATSDEEADAAASDLLDRAAEVLDRVDAHTDDDLALAAVRDVVGWNTVWDPDHHRVYTALTRNWLGEKFGGYGIWLNDVAYAALLAACAGDPVVARWNLETVLAGQQPAGNLPCLLTANEEWVDRSQPPVVAHLLRRMTARWLDTSLLHDALPALVRNYEWWMAARDGNRNGLIEYGSSPTGHGTFAHTRQGALNESSMDNLPMFDGATFDADTATLRLEDPGLNSLLVLEAEGLADLHAQVGDDEGARRLRASAAAHAERIRNHLWDPEREVFAARDWDGTFVEHLSPTSFYPMAAGVADEEQATSLLRHLLDPARFWGARPLPASPHDDPASADRVYWRGRIWPPMLFLTWEGLRRYGFEDHAAELADRAWAMFLDGWTDRRCMENLDPDGPQGDVGSDVDDFYTWGALLPLMRVLQQADANPWHGIILDASQGPVEVPARGIAVVLEPAGQGVRLSVGGEEVALVDGTSVLRGVTVDGATVRLSGGRGRVTVRLTGAVEACRVDEGPWSGNVPEVLTLDPGAVLCVLRPRPLTPPRA